MIFYWLLKTSERAIKKSRQSYLVPKKPHEGRERKSWLTPDFCKLYLGLKKPVCNNTNDEIQIGNLNESQKEAVKLVFSTKLSLIKVSCPVFKSSRVPNTTLEKSCEIFMP